MSSTSFVKCAVLWLRSRYYRRVAPRQYAVAAAFDVTYMGRTLSVTGGPLRPRG